jgi:hypothetical protein
VIKFFEGAFPLGASFVDDVGICKARFDML